MAAGSCLPCHLGGEMCSPALSKGLQEVELIGFRVEGVVSA